MSNDIDNLIKKYLHEKRNGKDFTEIRKELETAKLEENKIKIIIRTIDNIIIKEETHKASNIKSREIIAIGFVLTVLGLIITIGTYSGLIFTANSFLFAYGPLFTGIAIMLIGFNMRKK